jgi:alginate O-acetyltransferase complex protein AlgI
MLFNSLSFLLFLPWVYVLYWFVFPNQLKRQNIMLLLASYLFYSFWDWRFLFLLLFSTGLDYYSGLFMADAKSQVQKRFWFWISIGINLGFLGVFKYYDFFATSFAEMLAQMGWKVNVVLLQIILPVGISFYTFHGLSYVIDIYKNRITPERNFVNYALFVSYFPLLVAGPIERATHLLPQIKAPRVFNFQKSKEGIYQIIWGFFKKVVIADTCAVYVNTIFEHYDTANSLTLLMGAIYFAFQIYGDFSGYSDIALGVSKLFGIDLLRNFNFPYFSRDIAEFWRRWHISLSSWFRDYLYIPLGGNQGSLAKKIRNTFIIFLVSGFWHGANWTFIVWGGLNALYFLPLLIRQKNRTHLSIVAQGRFFPTFKELFQMLFTFGMTTLAWVFFRAATVTEAFHYLKNMFAFSFNGGIQYLSIDRYSVELGALLVVFIGLEWYAREGEHPIRGRYTALKACLLLLGVMLLGTYSNPSSFIYFQF